MNSNYVLSSQLIELKHIETDFTPFSFSYGFKLEDLINSIQKIGLINSPVLKKEGNKFIIVTGYKRILALKKLGQNKIVCNILKQEISPLECLLFSLYDNVTIRNFNHVEKGIILSKLSKYLSFDQIINEYMPLLGLPKYKPLLDLYLWIAELKDELKLLIVQERISINNLKLLFERDVSDNDLKAYTYVFKKLKLNFNQQRQFIEYSYDICMEKDISLIQFLEESGIKDLIEDLTLNIRDKIQKIMDIIRKKRFPNLYKAELNFYEKIKKMNLPDGVFISPSLYFESPYYNMTISFKDGSELKTKLLKLIELKDLEQIKVPWQR